MARWSLRLGEPFEPGGQASWAAPVDDGAAVLKVSFPHLEAEHEAAALRAYGGDGAVQLLDHDPEHWALLLERFTPGSSLNEVDDVVEPLASINERLWRATVAGPFRTLDEEITWHGDLIRDRRHLGVLPDPFVDRALSLQTTLLASTERRVLLHSDLHCGNALLSARGWLAIDPKPLVGDPAYGLAQALANERPAPPAVPALARRLGLDVERVRAWAFCRNVELAHGSAHRHGDPSPFVRLAHAYA